MFQIEALDHNERGSDYAHAAPATFASTLVYPPSNAVPPLVIYLPHE